MSVERTKKLIADFQDAQKTVQTAKETYAYLRAQLDGAEETRRGPRTEAHRLLIVQTDCARLDIQFAADACIEKADLAIHALLELAHLFSSPNWQCQVCGSTQPTANKRCADCHHHRSEVR